MFEHQPDWRCFFESGLCSWRHACCSAVSADVTQDPDWFDLRLQTRDPSVRCVPQSPSSEFSLLILCVILEAQDRQIKIVEKLTITVWFRRSRHYAGTIWNRRFISTVSSTVHTYPSWRRSFSEALFKAEVMLTFLVSQKYLTIIHRSGGKYPPLSPTQRWIIDLAHTTQAE